MATAYAVVRGMKSDLFLNRKRVAQAVIEDKDPDWRARAKKDVMYFFRGDHTVNRVAVLEVIVGGAQDTHTTAA